MAHAEICPVCAGRGLIHSAGTSGTMPDTTCHGCGGKGWVTVGGDAPIDIHPTDRTIIGPGLAPAVKRTR